LDGKWQSITGEIAADIQYLLEQIDESDLAALAVLPEVQELKKVWVEQFTRGNGEDFQEYKIVWRPTRCASCQREILAREESLSEENQRETTKHKSIINDNPSSKMIKGE
jgi:hypothetical protein